MEGYKRIAAVQLTSQDAELYNNPNGAIIKTILLHNTTSGEVDVTLSIDSVIFVIKLQAKETITFDRVIITNELKAKGNGVNIHVSGIQLKGGN